MNYKCSSVKMSNCPVGAAEGKVVQSGSHVNGCNSSAECVSSTLCRLLLVSVFNLPVTEAGGAAVYLAV